MRQPQYLRRQGILQILLSGFCFGFLGVFGKTAYSLGLTPGVFLSLRFLMASGILGIVLALRAPEVLRVGRWPALRALLLGMFGYALFSSCFFYALHGLSVSLTVLLLYTYPLWVTVGARFFFGEHLSPKQWAALPIVLGGLLLLLWGELQARDPFSLVLGMLSSVFYANYILNSRRWLKDVAPLGSAFYVMLGAGLVLASLHLRTLPSNPQVWLVLLGTSVVSTIFAISLFLAGLQKLSGAEASMLSLAEPITAVFLGVIVFGEKLLPIQWSGALLIAVGMLLVAWPKRALAT